MTVDAPTTLIPLDQISPGTLNPRSFFDQEQLEELAASIKAHGLLQPIIIRPAGNETFNAPREHGRPYTLIAGERRYRAAGMAGLTSIPATIREDLTDQTALEVTILENLHRENLEPLEEARGFQMLRDLCGLKQKQIATQVNRSADYVAASLRLLDLPTDTQKLITLKRITLGQARALWKYRQFPAFVDLLANAASNSPHYLDADTIAKLDDAFGWQGPSRYGISDDLATEIPGARYSHDTFEECAKCPFAARFGVWCLKTEHMRELRTRHDTEQDATAAATRAELEAAHPGIPIKAELKRDSYKDASPGHTPRGCDENCPCRSQALGYGGTPTPICTDPKRYTSLERRQTREDNAVRRKTDALDIEEIRNWTNNWSQTPEEAIHALALVALHAANPSEGDAYMHHIKAVVGDKNGAYRTNLSVDGVVHLSIPTDVLVRTAIEALCVGELEAHAKIDAASVHYTSRKYSDFLLPYSRQSTTKDTATCGSASTISSSPDGKSGEPGATPSSSTSPPSSTAAATTPTDGSSAPTSPKSLTTRGRPPRKSPA